MIYCRYCGKPLEGSASFCRYCGAQLASPAMPQAAPFAPAVPQGAPMAVPPRPAFVSGILGPVMLGAVFILLFIAAGVTNVFFTAVNLANVLSALAIMLPMALAAALTTRAKGPDLSIGAMMILSQFIIVKSAESASIFVGVLLAIAACAAIGAVSGALTVYAKLPAPAVTGGIFIVTAILFRFFFKTTVCPGNAWLKSLSGSGVLPLLVCVVCLAAAFIMIALTKLGEPLPARDKKKDAVYLLAYVTGGVFSALSGFLMLARTTMAVPYLPYSHLIFTVFVAGCVVSSRFFDNRFAPAAIAFAAALLWSLLSNILNLLSVVLWTQVIVTLLLAAAFGTVALVNWAAARKARRARQ
jgi:ribose/xylose/arabinose/galactoside ABC-type transport system permease subunit